MISPRRPWIIAATVLLAGCAGTPQQYSVKEVYVCTAEDCGIASQKYSSSQMAGAIERLLRENLGQEVTICDSDPTQRNCASVGVCHFVQGGPLPGSGCSKTMFFRAVEAGTQAGSLNIKVDMQRTFWGTPLACATMEGRIVVRSVDEITLVVEPHYCNWAGVGNMSATFNIAVESIDLDRGQIGGYWQHAVVGTGNGAGSGYAILKFPRSMKPGDNWMENRQ
ncbi:MAG: hypothetical protein AB1642_13000 [Pseudomonadota bacterium]